MFNKISTVLLVIVIFVGFSSNVFAEDVVFSISIKNQSGEHVEGYETAAGEVLDLGPFMEQMVPGLPIYLSVPNPGESGSWTVTITPTSQTHQLVWPSQWTQTLPVTTRDMVFIVEN